MLAQVIVDVPLVQTDKPYSYQVPEEFSPFLEKGMRVHVPFGKGLWLALKRPLQQLKIKN